MPTLTSQTTPTDLHIWHGVFGFVGTCSSFLSTLIILIGEGRHDVRTAWLSPVAHVGWSPRHSTTTWFHWDCKICNVVILKLSTEVDGMVPWKTTFLYQQGFFPLPCESECIPNVNLGCIWTSHDG